MPCLSKIWREFPSSVMFRFRCHTRVLPILDVIQGKIRFPLSANIELTVLQEKISSLVSVHAWMVVNKFLNFPVVEEFLEF